MKRATLLAILNLSVAIRCPRSSSYTFAAMMNEAPRAVGSNPLTPHVDLADLDVPFHCAHVTRTPDGRALTWLYPMRSTRSTRPYLVCRSSYGRADVRPHRAC